MISMKDLKLFVVFLMILTSCSEKEEIKSVNLGSENSVLHINRDDTVYQLNNSISLYIPKDFISENGEVFMDYLIIDEAKDFIENKVSTETIDNKELRTVGMIKINFRDSLKRNVSLNKPATLLNKNNKDEVKTFAGQLVGELIKWEEIKNGKSNEIIFKSLSIIKGAEYGLRTKLKKDTILLSTYLNMKIQKLTSKSTDNYGKIFFGGNPNSGFKFLSVEPRNGEYLDPELKDEITKLLEEIDVIIPPDYEILSKEYIKENIKIINRMLTIDFYPNSDLKLKELVENNSQIKTYDSGWYNFDIYLGSPNVIVNLKGGEPNMSYALVTFNSDRIIRTENNNGMMKFEFPIENKTKVMNLISYDDEHLYEIKKVLMKQGETHEVEI